MTVTLLQEKVDEVLPECMIWKSRVKASRKQLQSLAGKLNRPAKCIRPANRFSNRILAAIRVSPPPGYHVFNKDLLLDLEWFHKFAIAFNSVQLLPAAHFPRGKSGFSNVALPCKEEMLILW